MPDIIITPSSGKLEFVDTSAQSTRRHSFTMDANDGLNLDAHLSAAAISAPLNVINVTVNNSNVNYPFVLAQSGETGAKNLLMDGVGGTYNPFTNTATIDISGNSATTTLASDSTNLGGVAAASYVTLTGTQTLTNKTITGTFTGNLTGTGSWATNAVNANTATNSTQLNGQAASYYTNIPARLGYTPVNQAGDTISGNLTVNGNFAVNGSVTAFSASNIYITSSTLTVTDNILLMNALSPYQRYAGIQMYDSGSNTLSQFLWDGEGDYFFLTGSSVNGKIITGPDGQTNLTSNFIPKATAGYKLGNSLIYDNGTNVGIGTTSPDALLNVVGGHIHVGNATAFDNPASWNRTILIDGTNHARLRVRATALVSGNNNVNEAYLWVDNSVAPYSGLYAGYGFKLETGNSTHITLFPSSGNVGIGVSSPTTALHVSGVISGSSFSGAGTGLTGTAAGLSIGGSAASSTTAGSATTVTGTNGQLLTKDVRTIAPNNIANGYFQFGFTSWTNNNNSPYADYLHLRSYTDSSGGNDNLVMFRKDAIGMRIWQQTFGSASNYSTYKDVAFTDQIGNGTITIAAGTGVGVGTTNTFTTNQSGATTVTITNTGVTSLTTNTGLSSNVSATGAVTVTNTGVTSNVAGTGISVSGATGAVTITNSGVTSAVAGTGVGVSGATGAVTFSIGQAVGTGNSPTFIAVTTSTDGANHIMAGTTNAEGIRMTPASSTTYPVFLRSINPGVGEASPWIYKEQATDWGIWHNNPVNSIDFTKQGSGGIASNVGGSSSNTVTVRVEMATGFVQTIAGYRNSAGTTILDNNGNITGNAATVTTNANLTGDVTSTGNATTIASNAVTTAKIANNNVTLAKIENITAYTILGNSNASAAATPAALSVGTVATMLSGQTMNIAGSSTSCTGNAATATTATTANALNTSNSYTVTNLIASGYLQSTVGYLRTDDGNGIEVLTTTNSAQSINVKGILIGSSYDTTPPQNEIRTSNNQSLNLNARGTGDITLSTADGERVRLLNGGNVGIGTSNPGRKLDVEGIIRTRGASGTGGFEISAATTGTAKWRIEWDSASDSLDFNWVG